ncbi:MAG: hypothetical protein QME68_07870, partial [Elusimicrobiota bacterium]|nr:hypothetical protein [Elusimicrobiota bacterium]
ENIQYAQESKSQHNIKFVGSAIIRVIEPGKAELVSKEGAEIKIPDGAELKIPKDAVEQEMLITISCKEKLTEVQELARKAQKLKTLSNAFEFSPEGGCNVKFLKPVTISLTYSKNTPQKNVQLFRWNETDQKWECVENTKIVSSSLTEVKSLGKYTDVIVAEVYQLGIYQVMYIEENLSSPDATFKPGDVYVFPNPAKGGKNPKIHVEVGIADKVEIFVYDISAEFVHSEQISGSAVKQVNGRYYYEYEWDVSSIASGVYICVIHAEKSGEKPIKVIKKLAVIR